MLDQNFLNNYFSINALLKGLKLPSNGSQARKIKKIIKDHSLNIDQFRLRNPKRKFELISKICPVCFKEFKTSKGSKKEKTVCSHGCSNTFFRSGSNNPNWKINRVGIKHGSTVYRRVCFEYYPYECLVCQESKVVEVHHLDKDTNNNKIENLVPLCQTHHAYIHFGFQKEIQVFIDKRKYQ